MYNKLKFTEKHLVLVIGIPLILFGLSYFFLLVDHLMNSDLKIPSFYVAGTPMFFEKLVNIATGIIQFSASAGLVILTFVKIGKIWKW